MGWYLTLGAAAVVSDFEKFQTINAIPNTSIAVLLQHLNRTCAIGCRRLESRTTE